MINILLAIGTLFCAIQAIRTERLIVSSIWLAGTSALVSIIMYLLGAPEVAVIELSVGAGLVTVLFVFAINIAGDEKIHRTMIIPKPLAAAMVLISAILLTWLLLPVSIPTTTPSFAQNIQEMLWEDRKLDVLLQVVIIFCGILGVLGLLGTQHENGKADHQ